MNYIDHNFDWLEEKLQELEGKYVLFDFPGQVELYTHEASVFNILQKLQKLNYKVCVCVCVCMYVCMCLYVVVVVEHSDLVVSDTRVHL